MAIIRQGIQGPFSGKIGPIVGYEWRGRHCIRVYRRDVAYPNTEGQQHQRSRFVSMVRFASKANVALKLGFRRSALREGMTEGNYFVLKNKQSFEYKDGNVHVDYESLTLSEGPAADVYFHSAKFEQGEVVSVDFERNALQLRASGEDLVYLYFYAEGREEGYLSAPVKRRQKHISVCLPESWSGEVVHIYGFVVDREGRSSASTYIGAGKVDHELSEGRYIPVNSSWLEFVDIATRSNASSPESHKQAEEEDAVREVQRHAGVP